MPRFSANLGFLFTDRPLPEAIRAAHRAGFAAVECHWPFGTPMAEVRAALDDTGLPMLALNTRPGDSFGLAARPDRQAEARAGIDEALDYAHGIGARAVHVMAGTGGNEATFRANLAYACARAKPHALNILIEPINPSDVPGYTLTTTTQAAAILRALDQPNLAIMFDCYHVARTEGDVRARFDAIRARIGHVQIAAVPDRGAPDHGALDYATLLPQLAWPGFIGAEYRPDGPTETTLNWLHLLGN